jgi:hypothetical protein
MFELILLYKEIVTLVVTSKAVSNLKPISSFSGCREFFVNQTSLDLLFIMLTICHDPTNLLYNLILH